MINPITGAFEPFDANKFRDLLFYAPKNLAEGVTAYSHNVDPLISGIETIKKIIRPDTRSPSLKDTLTQKVSPVVEAVASGFQSSVPSSASSGVAGSPASAEEIMIERNPVQIDGAPITSAVSGIQDQESRLNAWTELMNNSAHQREVKDLIAAGLNPVLSARYGGSDSGSVVNVEPTSAVAAASPSGSGRSSKSSFLGLSPVSNPRTPLQMAYNLVVANGDKFVHAAKQIASAASKMD